MFAQRGDAPANSGHMLAHRQVEALDKGRVDLPTARREHLLDGRQGPEHHAVTHAHQAPPAHGLDHLRVEQTRQWQPARLRGGTCGLTAWRLDPVAEMGEQRRGVLLEAVGQEEGHTARGQRLDHLMDHLLRHRQGAIAGVEGQQQLGHGVDRHPHPVRGA